MTTSRKSTIPSIRLAACAVTGSLSLLAASQAWAGEPLAKPTGSETDKSDYTLFNPTPRELWRELSPDRPDTTESALTVDAGAYAIEASLFDFSRNNGDKAYSVMATNFKIGLTNNIDLQTVFEAYTWEDPKGGGGSEGFSDVTMRLKYNLWGNDGGDTALALFPFVKIPTGTALSNNEWEGGLIIPFSMDLKDGVGLGLMAEFDAVYDDVDDTHKLEFLHSAVLGFDLTEKIGIFTEYIGVASKGDYQAYFAGGFTYSVNDDFTLDCGVKVGLNDAAEDLGLFTGFTKRF